MGIPGPWVGQQPQKMCVVCGRLTLNDLVCDGCQSKSASNPGVARPMAYPIQEQGAQNEMPANMGWIVASVLSVLLAICFWYIFLRNNPHSNSGALAVTGDKPSNESQFVPPSAPLVQGTKAPQNQPSNPTNQPAISTGTGVVRNSQQGSPRTPTGSTQMASSDNLLQDMIGVSGAIVFMERFREEYKNDAANQEHQSWETYWQRVQDFYVGGAGWQATGNNALSRVASDKRSTLRAKWDNLGVVIAAEASKDDRVRRISSSDVSSFFGDLSSALSVDKGDGASILSKIDEVSRSAAELKSR